MTTNEAAENQTVIWPPEEFINVIRCACVTARYNGFTKDELKKLYALAGDLRIICEEQFNEQDLIDMQARGWTPDEGFASGVTMDDIRNYKDEAKPAF